MARDIEMTAVSHPTGTFEGRIWWMDRPANRADDLWVRDVIVTLSRIAFDFADPPGSYTVVLAPASDGPPSWEGTWRYNLDQSSGLVEARMYTSIDDSIVLVGNWVEYGKELDSDILTRAQD